MATVGDLRLGRGWFRNIRALDFTNNKALLSSLIPVLVTGIQLAQVLGLKSLPPPRGRASTGFL
ncbi:hypothetical protein AGR4C_Cc60031 [Agrobacterium tumefaciens str. Kerr 14]|uniref:Uncharacterized protein n=1 Tax=Agrobacterium tumefaciens str. Kerr 14 TaxID=1183424 RepID=A0A1S7Q972_AGRTU|nr:hypothetical protein AGR4C_Cc60031 [Agrobacterium tumefaciens str. Kerr 14]